MTNPPVYVNARALIRRQSPGGEELVVQTRNKPHEGRKVLELPGGQLRTYESFVSALRREVKEETGLDVTVIEGEETRLETSGSSRVECLRPYTVYQTLEGPVDSLGVYFLCEAEGDLLRRGDDTEDIRWLSLSAIAAQLGEDAEGVSWVDRAALSFYLRERGVTS